MPNILFVKLSSLGDVVHAMPALQDLRSIFPNAKVDWVVERPFADLVRRCAGVRRVIPVDLRQWRKSWWTAQTRQQWRRFKDELQSEQYDAVIDLQGLSKSALVSRLARLQPAGRRIAMGNRTLGSSYEAPTRWVADSVVMLPPEIHAVQRSRLLCARGLGYPIPAELSFGLAGQVGVLQEDLDVGVNIVPPTSRPTVALVHGSSREDKQWPLKHWLDLGQRLIEQGYTLALPHGNAVEERYAHVMATQLEHVIVWPRLDLDAMIDALNTCVGVVGVDSGLSHLAVALDLINVQIYNFNTAWRTGPPRLPHQVSVVGSPIPTVQAVWQAWLRATGVGAPVAASGQERRNFERQPA